MTGSCHGAAHERPAPPAARRTIAVLIKQVPTVAETPLGEDGRLERAGVAAEINPHCRRALAKGIELARELGTTCTVLSLGPRRAEAVLIEALACGADRAVLISDPLLAGADTLATARALAAAIAVTGPYDLVLTGRNSVDSDTGQVGAQVAELTGLAFVGPARELHVHGSTLVLRSELDDGWRESEVAFPVLVSCAERLCPPAKMPDPPQPDVLRARIETLRTADLGPGPWGQDGSPTSVQRVTTLPALRRASTPIDGVDDAVERLLAHLGEHTTDPRSAPVPEPAGETSAVIAVLAEPGRPRFTRELLGGAAGLAHVAGARVTVIADAGDVTAREAGAWGADEAVFVASGASETTTAAAVSTWCAWRQPTIVIAPGSSWGREVAARIAARLGAGLTGDAVGLSWDDGGLTCQKAVSGGSRIAVIRYSSPVQMATVRAGVFALRPPRPERDIQTLRIDAAPSERLFHVERTSDAGVDEIGGARVVIGVGAGVAAEDYPLLHELRDALGAELVATRKVTDTGVIPHYRQVGITGRSIAPDVYLALGVSGKANHTIGVRRAGFIAAVNIDPGAPVFTAADLGLVGDWRELARALIARVGSRVLVEDGTGR